MKDLKRKYKLVHSTPAHFVLHDGTAHFHVSRKGLNKDLVDKIQSLAEGGEIEKQSPVDSEKFKKMQEGMKNVFNEGGEVEPKEKKKKEKEDTIYEQIGEEITKKVPSDKAKALKNIFKNEGGEIQHFQEGGEAQANLADSSLPPDFEKQVQAEQVNLMNQYISSRPPVPGEVLPPTADPKLIEKFRTDAETNVAARLQQDEVKKAEASMMERENLTKVAQEEAEKIVKDNEIRAKAGLPLLPQKEQPSPQKAPLSQLVPQDQQISLTTPKQETGYQNPLAGMSFSEEYKKTLGGLGQAITEEGRLEQQKQALISQKQEEFVKAEQDRQKAVNESLKKIKEENDALYQQIANNKINPNRVWSSADTGSKIGAALGLIFAGIGSGVTGQPNQALQFIDKLMANDLEAQKAQADTRINLYKLGLEKYRDAQDAAKFATIQANAILAGQIQQIASKIGSPQAIEKAKQLKYEIDLKNQPLVLDLSLKDAALKYSRPLGAESGSAKSGVNQNKLVAFMNAGMYDDATKKELLKEQESYIKLEKLVNMAEKTFEDAAKYATVTNRLGVSHKLPTFRSDTKRYNAIVDPFLAALTKDVEGRVVPISVDLMRGLLPVVEDTPQDIAYKKEVAKDIIKKAYAFPNLLNKGLLSPRDPYITTNADTEQKFTPSKPIIKK